MFIEEQGDAQAWNRLRLMLHFADAVLNAHAEGLPRPSYPTPEAAQLWLDDAWPLVRAIERIALDKAKQEGLSVLGQPA